MLDALGPDLARTVAMRAEDSTPTETEIGQIFNGTDNVHKLRHYLPIYEAALARTERMLEIGVDRGGSLRMWRKYMPEATIVGIDINPKAAQHDAPEDRVHVRIGDQTDNGFLGRVLDEFGPFDTVLDDGGHSPKQMIGSFRYLFPRLKPGGVYVVEDVCANYWTPYRDQRESFIDFTKWLMDAMHAPYMQMTSVFEIMEGHPKRVGQVEVPLAATIIDRIEVFDSVVVVHRAPEPKHLSRAAFR
ncbi:class I SAM-dependent methyltransferase [Mycobacterium sp. 21AC1]|uniref:class I SAM-dependent methyltransferase n=1 Tax=[Mycobacterium] appelbergii TaxID=2939269 RepID=UPI002939529C|nr:class I SAM-dependent methyltransferase [Mycobacterium sp. 21AC1]MDV3130408.1 class I SAM-dependent methyltransferase [Mycobacterium sp. 21AC1]